MPLQIYNTLHRQKEEFIPLDPNRVGMYVCGPTVYSDTHIGHAKSYISFDVVRRYLMFLGYPLTYVQNITDVGHLTDDADEGEDKLIKKSSAVKQHPMQIAETYTRRFYEDLARLNVLPPDIAPRASGHIIEQIEIIKDLLAKGFAYEVGGSVYFDVTKDPDYGKLSGRKTEDQEGQGRVESRSEKRHPNDFALWKNAEKGHILRWPSPWGDGFPGWHIECSAMSMKYLGETFDIHGGGLENQFPHHECEIAQSESSTGKPFATYWMHNNMVTVDGVKMGKSLGNSSYLRDLFELYDPMTLRFYILQSHYRGTTEFKEDAIEGTAVGYRRLVEGYERLKKGVGNPPRRPLTQADQEHPLYISFVEAMNDDFNTSKALAVLFGLDKWLITVARWETEAEQVYQIWTALADDVLGILPISDSGNRSSDSDSATIALGNLVQRKIEERKEARLRKDFAAGDAIRDELATAGIILEDSKSGTTWSLS
ncbi:MAG: cysteine--tRNA ligase [bacterium]